MNYNELLRRLSVISPQESEYEARILIESFTQYKYSYVINRRELDLDSPELVNALERRENHEPLQYIVGKWEFYRQTYLVNENCLIPRSDTEVLVEKAIELLPQNASFLDLCTGSGAIAISVKKKTDAIMTASDISVNALDVARKNAAMNGVDICLLRAIFLITLKANLT